MQPQTSFQSHELTGPLGVVVVASRAVEIVFNPEFANVTANDTSCKSNAAVGYLATWAIHSCRHVRVSILGDREGNLHATYRDANGDVSYSLFGLRGDTGDYSFHS